MNMNIVVKAKEISTKKYKLDTNILKVLLSIVHICVLLLILNRFYGSITTLDFEMLIISVLSLSGLFIPINTLKKLIGYILNIIGGILIAISSISIVISLPYLNNGYYILIFIVAIWVLIYGVILCLTGTIILNEILTAHLFELQKKNEVRDRSESLLV